MAPQPGLGTPGGYVRPRLAANRVLLRTGRRHHSALNQRHGEQRPITCGGESLPGLRGLLFLFAELAPLHHRRRFGARFDPGKIRQRPTVGHALRRRPLFGAVRQDRRGNSLRDLCHSARSLPDLHARRSRMRHGKATARPAGVGLVSFRRSYERSQPHGGNHWQALTAASTISREMAAGRRLTVLR
jgi:hypothetical protein